MKKLLFAIILPFILISCNNTDNPTTDNTGTTDGTGTENVSNSGSEIENNSGTVEDSTGAVSISSDLKKIFDDVNAILGTNDSDIQKSTLSWNIYDGEKINSVKIDGYSVSDKAIKQQKWLDLGEKLSNYFRTWTRDNYNSAGGAGAELAGYFSGNLFCLNSNGITNPTDKLYNATEEEFANFDYYIIIECGEVESKKLDKLDGEFLFDGFGIEPVWSYEIKGNEIDFTSYVIDEVSENGDFKTQNITLNFEKILNNYYFAGDDVSGEIINETCFSDGAGFYYPYITKVNYKGITYSGCAEKIPFFAEGDNFFEYGKTGGYNEYVDKTGLDEKVEDDSNFKYSVDGIYKNFVNLSLIEYNLNTGDYAGGYAVVIEKTASGWEKIWEGQDIDYDSCKKAFDKDSGIWYWGPFRNCSETMPRG